MIVSVRSYVDEVPFGDPVHGVPVPDPGALVEFNGDPHRVRHVVLSYWVRNGDSGSVAKVYLEPASYDIADSIH